MASSFERWEKDPFFPAAEEVQESADRMESTYRTWIHAMKDTDGVWKLDELRRDLRTTLGTTKWQLEEFGQAVSSSYTNSNSNEDERDRHRSFIVAIESQIDKVESSLNESAASHGKPPLPWVKLDEGERNELALFLSGPSSSLNKASGRIHSRGQGAKNSKEDDRPTITECSRSSSHLVELCQVQVEGKENSPPGHRRTASASADIESWKIAVADGHSAQDVSSVKPNRQPQKIPSFSGFLSSMESSMSQLKWSKNGYKKLKHTDRLQEADSMPPRSQNLARGVNICYEKSKSCLDGCDEYYDKQLYGWSGAIQRQLQRSQYYMQYSRSVQVFCSMFLILCVLVLFVLRSI
ncbi:uncharacterized protein LOC127256980 [Andrographis paniculata]|uniref:uncharacterized protein LOC127256980 n=1 Tax=Andrographis paniculata TaxID=175694 RepID=UPI0021E90B98|nr:uncharacterized protein LOC127256980 [Andrographis paniculata]